MRWNKAQSTLEYSVFACVLVAALMAMYMYMRRGIEGGLRKHSEDISSGAFYSPKATSGTSVTNSTVTREWSYSWSEAIPLHLTDNDHDARISYVQTAYDSTQDTSKTEEVLPFSAEPVR